MLTTRRAAVVFGLLAALFVGGLMVLFQLRFESGDVYPPYSTLRADPLGARAYYESLAALPGLDVRQWYEPLPKLRGGRDTTLFLLGVPPSAIRMLSAGDARDLDKFLQDGGRVVVTLYPEVSKTYTTRRAEQKAKEKKDKAKKQKPSEPDDESPFKKKKPVNDDEGTPASLKPVSLKSKWGVGFDYKPLRTNELGALKLPTATRAHAEDDLPATLSWHTALHFTELAPEWRVLYERDGVPVFIERPVGKGTLVFAADSYFASNEAMRKEREPRLLAWLAGANRRLVFDETHLGVEADPGIAALIRKYRLHGLVCGLVLLAVLFVWQNSTSFLPPLAERVADTGAVAGRDSAAGFVNLLRRSLKPGDLLPTCFAEWKKSCARHRLDLVAKLARMETAAQEEASRPAAEQNPVRTYQALVRILSEQK